MADTLNKFFCNTNFKSFDRRDLEKLMNKVEISFMTDKNNWSKKKFFNELDSVDCFFLSKVIENFREFCEIYYKKHKYKRGKKVLDFAISLQETFLKNNTKKEYRIAGGAKNKEFWDAARHLNTYLNCSGEELIDVLFGKSKIHTKCKPSTLRKYFYG